MSNVTIHAAKLSIQILGLAVHPDGIVLGFRTKTTGKSFFNTLMSKLRRTEQVWHIAVADSIIPENLRHCVSELHQPNNFEIYRTSKECCDEHYGGSADCITKSKAEHERKCIHEDEDETFHNYQDETFHNYLNTSSFQPFLGQFTFLVHPSIVHLHHQAFKRRVGIIIGAPKQATRLVGFLTCLGN